MTKSTPPSNGDYCPSRISALASQRGIGQFMIMAYHWLSLILVFSGATALQAEQPMGESAFEQYTEGKTIYFGQNGVSYGAEQYLPGRKVYWSLLDGECQTGRWYPEGNLICVVYEGDDTGPKCWSVYWNGAGISARRDGLLDGFLFEETGQSQKPLECVGPKVGV